MLAALAVRDLVVGDGEEPGAERITPLGVARQRVERLDEDGTGGILSLRPVTQPGGAVGQDRAAVALIEPGKVRGRGLSLALQVGIAGCVGRGAGRAGECCHGRDMPCLPRAASVLWEGERCGEQKCDIPSDDQHEARCGFLARAARAARARRGVRCRHPCRCIAAGVRLVAAMRGSGAAAPSIGIRRRERCVARCAAG